MKFLRTSLLVLGLSSLGICGHKGNAQVATAFVVYPEFINTLANVSTNPPAANSLAIYSGSWGGYSPPGSGLPPTIPSATNGTEVVRLAHSGFGQTFARTIPYPNFEITTISNAQLWLYPAPTLVTREQIAGSTNAFRYKELLYKPGTNGQVRAEFESIATFFGDAERQRARNGIEEMRHALKYAPLHRGLRNALLDAYYDFVVAEAQHIKNDLAQIAQYRLGLIAIPPTEFIIDKEIGGYTNVLRKYDGILREYAKLLVDPAGIDVRQIDPSATPGINLGAYIFQREQPFRNQMAVQFRDTNGLLVTVSGPGLTNEVVFAGYKDFVALLGVLRDYAQSASELAKLYGMRGRSATQAGQKDDRTLGFELIDTANSEVQLNVSFLRSLVPGGVPPDRGSDASGVLSALAGVQTATAELSKVGGFLAGQVNALGFDRDFLVLINTFVTSDQQHLWDSYDALRGWIDFGQTTSILRRARDLFNEAQVKHETFRGYADQVFNEMDANADEYAQRYLAIAGYLPEEPPDLFPPVIPPNRYPPVTATTVASHINNARAGSELRQVYQSIEQANEKADDLAQFGEALHVQLTNTWQRFSNSLTRANVISDATKDYQGVIRTERDTITTWSAKQAGMQAAYDMVADIASIAAETSSLDPGKKLGGALAITAVAAMGAANIAIQTIGEEKKGEAEKNLDLAAADFEKNLAMADTDQIIFQAAEEVRNLEREKASNVLARQDNEFLRNQELGKAEGLLRELEQTTTFRDQNNSELAGRYYADPIHFLRAQNAMIRADFAFREAQRWIFFTLRALEYKYNKPFVYSSGGTTWELSSLFKLRNYSELEDLLSAMDQYNLVNLNTINGRTPFTDRISLKNDVWARTTTNVSARLGVFQSRLRDSLKTNSGVYEIKLNLFRLASELESGFLFRGAQYDPGNGQLQSAGFYLDKIDWIKIKFVDGTAASETPKVGNLSYGGTSYVRPFCASAVDEGLERPNELRSFPFRYFVMFTDAGGALKVNSFTEQQATARISFLNAPGEPGAGFENDFWRERSVANTDLTLTVPASSLNPNAIQDIEIYIKHRFAIRISCQP